MILCVKEELIQHGKTQWACKGSHYVGIQESSNKYLEATLPVEGKLDVLPEKKEKDILGILFFMK